MNFGESNYYTRDKRQEQLTKEIIPNIILMSTSKPISDNNEPVANRNSRANLERMLNEMLQQPERRAEIKTQIQEMFAQQKAVMCLDMSGFSRTTRALGIVEFLLMIHQMQLLAKPSIEGHKGLVVKAEGDNLFCLFDTVADAFETSRDIKRKLDSVNVILPEDRRMYVSIGIGYGEILNIEDKDLFGDEVNLSSKLGEDIGRMGDVLLTQTARDQLGDTSAELREETISISGLTLTYFSAQD